LIDLPVVALPVVALSGVDAAAASELAAMAGNGAAKHTRIPVAMIKAERPLALIVIRQSPHFARP
jgi:hypothetical protein